MAQAKLNNISSFISFTVLVVFGVIQLSDAQYITLGLCPRIGGMRDFNISRYEGLWYEVEKYWFAVEATASCTNVRYVANPDGTFGVEINMLEEITRTKMSMPGVTWYRSRDGSADFMLDLLVTQSPIPFHFKYPYLVLDTDYDNYTIKYLCKQLGPFSAQTMWVLSREKSLSPESREHIYNFLRRVGINVQKLRRSNTSTCGDIGK
ncbi:lopap [Folsomia candida]|uniref:Lopap n=1 Tax=Folsomia candida TaxID=158441 RepID=A0A226E6N0_FOLCA|nr:lopap [Folsomia candida]OXA52236.1 Lopap [Folsomia candida]